MGDRPVFGLTDPPPPGPKMLECGWHPECGHVLEFGFPKLAEQARPGLVYGLLEADEAFARSGPCAICLPTPAEQQALELL